MSEKKEVFITKTVVITAAAVGISLCLITLIIQYLVFPNFVFENKEKVKVEITHVSATSPSQGQPSIQGDQLTSTDTPSMIGVIAVGMNIKVSGTGNEGLRMRSGAGIDQQTMFLAQEGESFRIIEGPKILDSLIWWKIQALNDPNKVGWSVQDYMVPN
jgi:hypothetical protein